MDRKYYTLPNSYISIMGKVASASLARAVMVAYYPDICARVDPQNGHAHYPDGATPDTMMWQSLIPKTETPDKDIYMFVRDPVERFRSAMAQEKRTDIDATVALLNAEEKPANNFHFAPQSGWLRSDVTIRLYRFPDHLQTFATDTGLAYPFPDINSAKNLKPILTVDQITAVQAYYSEDIALYNSILEAAKIYVPNIMTVD